MDICCFVPNCCSRPNDETTEGHGEDAGPVSKRNACIGERYQQKMWLPYQTFYHVFLMVGPLPYTMNHEYCAKIEVGKDGTDI
jgi:hypothetical protein